MEFKTWNKNTSKKKHRRIKTPSPGQSSVAPSSSTSASSSKN